MVVDMAIALKVAVSAWRPCFAQMRTVTRSCASTRAQVRDGRSVAVRLRLAPASARHRHKEAAAVVTLLLHSLMVIQHQALLEVQ